MIISKEKDAMGNNEYVLSRNNLAFKMYYGGNLDLYWEIRNKEVNGDNFETYEEKPLEFIISPDDGEVYSTFSHLIDNVISTAKYVCDEEEKEEKELMNNLDELVSFEDEEEKEEELKAHELMVRNSVVVWHSDDDEIDRANFVTLTRINGNILLTFRKGIMEEDIPGVIPIRFRTSGSRYAPFNKFFMQHFQEIDKVVNNLDQDQQHMRKLTSN